MRQSQAFTQSIPSLIISLGYAIIGTATLFIAIELRNAHPEPFYPSAILGFLVTFISFRRFVARSFWNMDNPAYVGGKIIFYWLVTCGAVLFQAYLGQMGEDLSRLVFIFWFTVTPFVLIIFNIIARIALTRYLSAPERQRTAVIVRLGRTTHEFVNTLNDSPHLGLRILGFFDDRRRYRRPVKLQYPILGSFRDTADYVNEHNVDVVFVHLPIERPEKVLNVIESLNDTTASIYAIPDLRVFDLMDAQLSHIQGVPLLAVSETPFYGVSGVLKRSSDILLASLILILISPLLITLFIAVKLSSPGPAVFKQKRYGLDGKSFTVFKFRSMKVHNVEEGGEKQATKDDDRITPIGRFMRRTSLDELPQFFNVLGGSMSIVGPRPHAVSHNESYRHLIKGYMIRHKVKPGITGWAQVNGFRGETETVEKMRDRVTFDMHYIRHWSLALDIKIIIKTALLVFKDENAY